MSTQSQKRASQAYRERLRAKGNKQHLIWATDSQWEIISPVSTAIKNLETENITQVHFDDDGKYIKFIYDNQAETRVVSPNRAQDDEG